MTYINNPVSSAGSAAGSAGSVSSAGSAGSAGTLQLGFHDEILIFSFLSCCETWNETRKLDQKNMKNNFEAEQNCSLLSIETLSFLIFETV